MGLEHPEWIEGFSGGPRRRQGHSLGLYTPTPGLYFRAMRFHTYSKFSPEMADAVDLQALLDKLADFLLQSGFAGGQNFDPYLTTSTRSRTVQSRRSSRRFSTR